MKKFFKLFISLCLVFSMAHAARAEGYKVLVLPDNIQFESTNYFIYPDASIIFASDTINEIKKDGRLQTVSMTEVRDALRKNTKLKILTKRALQEYKYNYNIPFVDFKAIANCFDTDKVLVITSQTDVQNYFLRRTLWDFLNIPGATVVDPAYKLSIYVALVDVNKEQVLWQSTYYKNIASMENRITAQNFAPATEQLEKIKFYSLYFLSPEIARKAESKILPPFIPTIPGIKDVSNTTAIPNFQLPETLELKTKPVIPQRMDSKSFGEVINDL